MAGTEHENGHRQTADIKGGTKYEDIHKRKICTEAYAGSGSLQHRGAGESQGCGKETGDFGKVFGADYFHAEQGRICPEYPGSSGRLYAYQRSCAVYRGGHFTTDRR